MALLPFPSASRFQYILLILFFITIFLVFTDTGALWRQPEDEANVVVAPALQQDAHPIRDLMRKGSHRFEEYVSTRSTTFKQAVKTYRVRYGRHPPPGYKEWYKFARQRNVYNIDDFAQIHDDLRPFWGLKPSIIRNYAAHSVDDPAYENSLVAIRNGRIHQSKEYWRPEIFVKMLGVVAEYLPDMDIPMNNLDQPRVVVPWEELQALLQIEESTRSLQYKGVTDQFTKGMSNFWVPAEDAFETWTEALRADLLGSDLKEPEAGNEPAPEWGWFDHRHKQYMELCANACPPESYARNTNSKKAYQETEKQYKDPIGGLVTNFNLSSDLCTVGTQLADIHGLLYASTSMLAITKLVPMFSECKVNVNNDILYPANMYYKHDDRYEYPDSADAQWSEKEDLMVWRGATSGGTTLLDEGDKWKQMHRQRFVILTNATELAHQEQAVLALSDPEDPRGPYELEYFKPAAFAAEHTDIGFTDKYACIPNCDFYNSSLVMLDLIGFEQTFRSKYLVDIDGMSFSGRWRAFLQSRSLGIKATIFREWHDSRLFAWKHFVPMDNRFDDLYSLLAYFIGVEQRSKTADGGTKMVKVPPHDYEAWTMAHDGREWAQKVLRREDMEIYLYRLMLEYGRIIDDNRDRIGFVGDGGKEMEEFDSTYPGVT